MTQRPHPRHLTDVTVEANNGTITVAFGLGAKVDADAEYFGYGVDYYGPDGNGGKRLGVRFGEEASAHIFDWTSSTQANYASDAVTAEADRIVVTYRDADLGLDRVGSISAFSHVDGDEVQVGVPVTLLV